METFSHYSLVALSKERKFLSGGKATDVAGAVKFVANSLQKGLVYGVSIKRIDRKPAQ